MDAVNKPISVVEPVNKALEKTKILLFSPFNLEKWFIIGFCAWLANLIKESAFNGINLKYNGGTNAQTAQATEEILEFVRAHIVLVSISIILMAALFITIFLLCLWLSSRGRFMFLDCLAKNKAQIKAPWKIFKQQANSLFGFRLLVMITSFVIITALGIPVVTVLGLLKSSAIHNIAAGTIVVAALLLIVAAVLLFSLIHTFTTDFIVPIMYVHRISILASWRKFLPLFWQHFWKVILYLIFKVLLSTCIAVIMLALTFVGCCCLCGVGIILFMPYISTVATLPFSSFLRLYALCFLRQFGSEFDVFVAAA